MKRLILVTGYKRVGKDSFAEKFCDTMGDHGIFKVAKKVVEVAAMVAKISYEDFNENKDKWRMHIVNDIGEVVTDVPIRHIAEVGGNEAMTHYGFSKHAIVLASMPCRIFEKDEKYKMITDIRLVSEVDAFKMANYGYEVVVLRINRTNYTDPVPSSHRTNVECNLIEQDYTINASNIEELSLETNKFIKWLENSQD